MPSETKYQVDSRYTTRKALAEKLQKIFPSTNVADFGINMVNDIWNYKTPRPLTSDEEDSLKKDE